MILKGKMAKITVKKTVIPVKAMACYDFTPLDYADAYQVQLKDKLSLNITELANHIFGTIESYPLYVRFFFTAS